jgi:hypothetical protein
MKTYLTPTQFVEVFWNRYKAKSDATLWGTVGDKIAWSLFQAYEQEIKETLVGSMHGIEGYSFVNPIDYIGHQFHKSFRQTDPIDAPHLNGIIWVCLGDAPLFWKCLNHAGKILVSEDLANNFINDDGE